MSGQRCVLFFFLVFVFLAESFMASGEITQKQSLELLEFKDL